MQGTLVSETKCLACSTITAREEAFYDLSLDIEQNCSVTACLKNFRWGLDASDHASDGTGRGAATGLVCSVTACMERASYGTYKSLCQTAVSSCSMASLFSSSGTCPESQPSCT